MVLEILRRLKIIARFQTNVEHPIQYFYIAQELSEILYPIAGLYTAWCKLIHLENILRFCQDEKRAFTKAYQREKSEPKVSAVKIGRY